MGKKPLVYANGPAQSGKHYIDSREQSHSVRIAIVFKKGLGPEQTETFRREMSELIDALIAVDAAYEEKQRARQRDRDGEADVPVE